MGRTPVLLQGEGRGQQGRWGQYWMGGVGKAWAVFITVPSWLQPGVL